MPVTNTIHAYRLSAALDADHNLLTPQTRRQWPVCVPGVTTVTKAAMPTVDSVTAFSVMATDGTYLYARGNAGKKLYRFAPADLSGATWTNQPVEIIDFTYSTGDAPFSAQLPTNMSLQSMQIVDGRTFLWFACHAVDASKGGMLFFTDDADLAAATWTRGYDATRASYIFHNGCQAGFTRMNQGNRNGQELCMGPYGTNAQQDSPRKIYYSADFGANWHVIYDPYPDVEEMTTAGDWSAESFGMHVHCCTFGRSSNEIIVTTGDPQGSTSCHDQSGIYRLTRDGSSDKTLAASWIKSWIARYSQNPTVAYVKGDWLYLGKDAGNGPLIQRYNLATAEWQTVLNTTMRAVDSAYVPRGCTTGNNQVFSIYEYEGVLYAAVHQVSISGLATEQTFIYVSVDGEHWSVIASEINSGYYGFIAAVGECGGYLWGDYATSSISAVVPIYFAPVSAIRVDGDMVCQTYGNAMNYDNAGYTGRGGYGYFNGGRGFGVGNVNPANGDFVYGGASLVKGYDGTPYDYNEEDEAAFYLDAAKSGVVAGGLYGGYCLSLTPKLTRNQGSTDYDIATRIFLGGAQASYANDPAAAAYWYSSVMVRVKRADGGLPYIYTGNVAKSLTGATMTGGVQTVRQNIVPGWTKIEMWSALHTITALAWTYRPSMDLEFDWFDIIKSTMADLDWRVMPSFRGTPSHTTSAALMLVSKNTALISNTITNVAIVEQPQHGEVVDDGNTLTYTPATDYTGYDWFYYNTGAGTAVVRMNVWVYDGATNGANGLWDIEFDCYQQAWCSDHWPVSPYCPGDIVPASERVYYALAGAGDTWSLALDWHPYGSSVEWPCEIPVATVRFSNNTYLYLYWSGSDTTFKLTDGTTTITTAATSFERDADIKFALANDPDGALTLHVCGPAQNGTPLTASSASLIMAGSIQGMACGANPADAIKGCAVFSRVYLSETALDGAGVLAAFNRPALTTPLLTTSAMSLGNLRARYE